MIREYRKCRYFPSHIVIWAKGDFIITASRHRRNVKNTSLASNINNRRFVQCKIPSALHYILKAWLQKSLYGLHIS